MKEEFYFGLEVTLQKKVSQVKLELFHSLSSILSLFSVFVSRRQKLINMKRYLEEFLHRNKSM